MGGIVLAIYMVRGILVFMFFSFHYSYHSNYDMSLHRPSIDLLLLPLSRMIPMATGYTLLWC